MSEELSGADFLDPVEFGWTPERAKAQRAAREFAASLGTGEEVGEDRMSERDESPDELIGRALAMINKEHGVNGVEACMVNLSHWLMAVSTGNHSWTGHTISVEGVGLVQVSLDPTLKLPTNATQIWSDGKFSRVTSPLSPPPHPARPATRARGR